MLKWLAVLLMVPLVSASFISMTTEVSTEVSGDVVTVDVSTQNNGDESAYNVKLTTELEGTRNSSQTKDILGVGQSFETDMSMDLSGLDKPGTYPLVVRVDYADANGYPFSAITHSSFDYQHSTSSEVFANIGKSTITEEGETNIRLRVRNMGNDVKQVRIRLVTPKEISTEGEKTVEIRGGSQEVVEFEISSFGALAGSSYAVLAVTEYEGDLHHSSVTRGTVKIVEPGNLLLDNWFLLAALVLLVLIVVAYQFKSLRWRFWKGRPSSVA